MASDHFHLVFIYFGVTNKPNGCP